MILALILACTVHAEQAEPQPTEPTAAELLGWVESGTSQMREIEATVNMLPPEQLAEAREAAKTLTSTCPYNGASLQLMGVLIDQVPEDSATRPGVDSMARMLAQLELEPGAHSIDDTRHRMDKVDPEVQLLTEEQSATIDASGETLARLTGTPWPPKGTYTNWKDQLRAEGHDELASLIELAMNNRC